MRSDFPTQAATMAAVSRLSLQIKPNCLFVIAPGSAMANNQPGEEKSLWKNIQRVLLTSISKHYSLYFM